MDALAHLTNVTGAFLRDLGSSAPPAALADIRWTVADLGAHLGGLHRWAAGNAINGERGDRENVPTLSEPLTEWYGTSREIMLSAFNELDPDAECYTLSRSDRSVRFWHRRQLFETVVHLWDLRSAKDPAAPPPAEVPAQVHAEGVSELFDVFLPRFSDQDRVALGGGIQLVASDTGDRWTFDSSWDRSGGHDCVATVTAPAGDLLLWVWNRGSARTVVQFEGNADVIRRFEHARVRP